MMEAQLPLSFPQSKQQVRYKCWDDSSRKTANGVSSKVDLEHMMRTLSPTIAVGSAAPQSLSFPSCFIWTDEVPYMAGSSQIQASQAPQLGQLKLSRPHDLALSVIKQGFGHDSSQHVEDNHAAHEQGHIQLEGDHL